MLLWLQFWNKTLKLRDFSKELRYVHNCPEKKIRISRHPSLPKSCRKQMCVRAGVGPYRTSKAPGSRPKSPAQDQPLRATCRPQRETESTNRCSQTIYKSTALTYHLQHPAPKPSPYLRKGHGRQPACGTSDLGKVGWLPLTIQEANQQLLWNPNSQAWLTAANFSNFCPCFQLGTKQKSNVHP